MKKIIKSIYVLFKDLVIEYYDLVLFLLCFFVNEVLLRHFTNLGFGKLAIIYNLMIICLIFVVLILINKKIRWIIQSVLLFLITFYSMAQTLHFSYFNTFFSFKKITVVGELKGVFGEIFGKFNLAYLLFILPFVIFIIIYLISLKKERNNKTPFFAKIIVIGLVLCFVTGSSILVKQILKADSEEKGWLSDQYLLDSFHSNVRFLDRFGLLEYIAKDAELTIKQNSVVELSANEQEELEQFIKDNYKAEVNEMTGIFEGKNLVLVLAESFNNFGINEELTPTIYKMSEEGYYFTNHYAPIYQSATGDSEFISLTSMMPSVDYGTTSYTFHNNVYKYSLPKLFIGKGYNANSYHSYITNFYNRELFHSSLGFTRFYGEDSLGLKRNEYFMDGFNWHNDDILFNTTIMNTNTSGEQPFFDFVITTSGHMPYVQERDEIFLNLDEIEESGYSYLDIESKCYLSTQMNLDYGLQQLLEDLEKENVLNDTIIVIYGDHYPYGLASEEAINTVVNAEGYKMNRVPFIIYDPTNSVGKKIDTLSSTFDIFPTLCNLFNLDYSGAYTVGRDLFSNEVGFVPFMDRSILTEDFYYNGSTNEIEILSTNYEETEKDLIMNRVKDMFELGQKILKTNYYGR